MLRGDRLAGIAIVLILLFSAWVGHELGYDEGYSDGGDKVVQEQLDGAAGSVLSQQTFVTPPPAEQNNWHQEKDLKAQQAMARYALWMICVSALMAGITGWGVWFVAQTLEATREAVKEAKNATLAANKTADTTRVIGEAQTRCYPNITKIYATLGDGRQVKKLFSNDFPDVVFAKRQTLVEVYFQMKNFGRSPMREFVWKPAIKYRLFSGGKQGRYYQSEKLLPVIDEALETPPDEQINESGALDFPIDEAIIAKLRSRTQWAAIEFYVVLSVHYRDVFGHRFDEEWAYLGMAHADHLGSGKHIELQRISSVAFHKELESATTVQRRIRDEE